MSGFEYLILFLLGTAFGSFLNVVIFRFDPDKYVLRDIYGRSRCMNCEKTLSWYELIPILSFALQGGKCRSCKDRLSMQYPLVELLSGLAFVLAGFSFLSSINSVNITGAQYLLMGLWLIVILILIVISAIDFRTRLIPDELNIAILFLGFVNAFVLLNVGAFGATRDVLYKSLFGTHAMVNGSFLGTKGMSLWITESLWLNLIYGALFGALLFGGIYFLSRGRAMGFGDVKLAIVAGFLLGFPDMLVATMLAFITGSIAGLYLIIRKKKKGLKDTMPFGPFIALGIILTVFFGYDIVSAYFGFFEWIY